MIPRGSAVFACTAIGYTNSAIENWFGHEQATVECVGIPRYPGSPHPRVAGLVRFMSDTTRRDVIKFVHGNVLEPQAQNHKIICQLVNDAARTWGGGVARMSAKKYPTAQFAFSKWITGIPRSQRLGKVHFASVDESITIASLVGQQGYGTSVSPRIRYLALEDCFDKVADFALDNSGSVHMPRLGMGQSAGSWDTVEEIVRSTLASRGIPVIVYDLPPRRVAGELFA